MMAGDVPEQDDLSRREAQKRLRGKNLAILFALIAWVALCYVIAFVKFPTP
ncbi:MAG: hypothetical protein AAF414_21985 [Pseudomonadota bacterium]